MSKKRQRYFSRDGTELLGVTTIISDVYNVEPLKWWANKQGKLGVDLRELLDEKANIGTLTHEMILHDFKEREEPEGDYTDEQKCRAVDCYHKFLDWRDKYESIKPISIETPLVSEVFRYGGTPDFYGEIDGKKTLIDFKTSSATYDSHIIQLGAYYMLLKEHEQHIDRAGIVNLPIEGKKAKETFISKAKLETGFKIFKHCLNIYRLKRKL